MNLEGKDTIVISYKAGCKIFCENNDSTAKRLTPPNSLCKNGAKLSNMTSNYQPKVKINTENTAQVGKESLPFLKSSIFS